MTQDTQTKTHTGAGRSFRIACEVLIDAPNAAVAERVLAGWIKAHDDVDGVLIGTVRALPAKSKEME